MGKKEKLIGFIDTETTDLVKPIGTNLDEQPYMIEIFIQLRNQKLKVIDEYETLIKPPIEIPIWISKHTNIWPNMVQYAPVFKDVLKEIKTVFSNIHEMVAQNLMFDMRMLEIEFQRHNKKIKRPPILFCTVEQSMHFKGFRLTSSELNEQATGSNQINNHHRAKADVEAMVEYYKMIKKGYLPKHLKGVK